MKKVLIIFSTLTMLLSIGSSCHKVEEQLDVSVLTYAPQYITTTTALCGGSLGLQDLSLLPEGFSFDELGVCWSTMENPTVDDSHTSTTNWNEPYVCTIMGLEQGRKYHVRAYALKGTDCFYGEDKSFTTEGAYYGNLNGHEYVDLGLPSGTLWATCNIGADCFWNTGDFIAWGETAPKDEYSWTTYKYAEGAPDQLTKYCNNPGYGYNGFTDNLLVLEACDDAATVNWGEGWYTPTWEQWMELSSYTNVVWTCWNGADGELYTGRNGRSIFMPISTYWTSSLSDNCHYMAKALNLAGVIGDINGRKDGLSIRPVYTPEE